jgi:hypothetical protein
MKGKKHNGTSKRAERFRESGKELADLNFSAANIHSVEDKAQNAFEEEP